MLLPSRHELVVALRFPLLVAPFLLLFVRYRMLGWQQLTMNFRDHVDYSPETWRISSYITVLFIMAAYPLGLAEYRGWFWAEHRTLTVSLLLFWISLGMWIVIRYVSFEKQDDEQLRHELDSISLEVLPPAVVRPRWLRTWGWANLVIFVVLLTMLLHVVLSL